MGATLERWEVLRGRYLSQECPKSIMLWRVVQPHDYLWAHQMPFARNRKVMITRISPLRWSRLAPPPDAAWRTLIGPGLLELPASTGGDVDGHSPGRGHAGNLVVVGVPPADRAVGSTCTSAPLPESPTALARPPNERRE